MRGIIFLVCLMLAGLGLALLIFTDMLGWGTNLLLVGAVGCGLMLYLPKGDQYDYQSR